MKVSIVIPTIFISSLLSVLVIVAWGFPASSLKTLYLLVVVTGSTLAGLLWVVFITALVQKTIEVGNLLWLWIIKITKKDN